MYGDDSVRTLLVTRYASVVLDADSTIAGIEGIDWLAARRGAAVQQQVEELTARAMNGEVALEAVYERRLAIIGATAADLLALSAAYLATIASGAREAILALHEAGVAVYVVSGGLRPALLPMTRSLGIADARVHAVEPVVGADGCIRGAAATPLLTQAGKAAVVAALQLARPALAVGDGATDAAMRPAVDAFAAYVGFVRRDAVVARADIVLESFAGLVALVVAP